MKSIVAIIMLTVCTVNAGIFTGKINEVWVNGVQTSNIGWIFIDGELTDSRCKSKQYIALDLSDESMKMALSFALSAQVAGKTVTVQGDSNKGCLELTDGRTYEYLKYIVVK